MVVLTKSSILQGIKQIQKINIKTLDGELYLRPLSSAEVNEVLNIEAEGYGNFEANARGRRTDASGKMNLKRMNEASANAQYTAIFKSINNEKNEEWSEDDVKDLPKDVVEELYDHIMRISGAEVTESDVANFPED